MSQKPTSGSKSAGVVVAALLLAGTPSPLWGGPWGRGEVSIFAAILHRLGRVIPFIARRWRAATPPPPEQLELGLDQLTDTGLPLRDALPVRSAEYWLQMGEPDLALKELQTLSESARQHPWPLRVHVHALHAATPH